MKLTLALAGILLIVVSSGGHPSTARARTRSRLAWRVSQFENVLGTSLELKFAVDSDNEAARAEAAALAEIERLDHILSGYERESEFNRWLSAPRAPTSVSPELFEALSLFDEWRARTNGALDPAAQVVSELWRRAATERRTPSADELQAAVATVARAHYRLDGAARTATRLDDAPLILNSFVKSYIANRAADAAMRVARLDGVVVNIGGDLVARGAMAEDVRIADPKADAENDKPLAWLLIRNRAVATSGNYRRGVEINGRWYSHIVDPRTALPVDHVISATVVAPQAADAGALATAFCVLTPEESLRLAASLPEVECLLITKNGERIESEGWRALEAPAPGAAGPNAAPQVGDQSFELVINLELARPEGPSSRGYRRPYVAVWIEDKDRNPVRTLALWYQKPKWLPDLRAWSRANRMRTMAGVADLTGSVSSATRPAGKYTIKWDGRDSHGNPVKPGKYIVFIEATREHGTYQLMRQEIDFNGEPKHFNLPGNIEIASVTIDYRKKSG
jgi:thiamine biosynthesis lipoprotein ApbE